MVYYGVEVALQCFVGCCRFFTVFRFSFRGSGFQFQGFLGDGDVGRRRLVLTVYRGV